jgi:TonB family protein
LPKYMTHFTKTFTRCLLLCGVLPAIFAVAQAQPKKKPAVKKTTPVLTKTASPIKVIKLTKPTVGGVVNGKAILLPNPVYPEDALKLRIAGKINIQVLIDENGNVMSAKAENGGDNLSLRKSAETAAMQAKFSITLLNGEPVKVSGVIVYNFILGEEPKNYRNETKFMGLGVFFSVIHNAATDLVRFGNLFDFKDFKAEFPVEFGNFPEPVMKEIETLSTLPKLSEQERLEAIDKVLLAIEPMFSEAELWQFRLGKDFGDFFDTFSSAVGNEGFDPDKFNESSAKLIAANIKDSLKSAPPAFSDDIVKKINEILVDLDKADITSPKLYTAVIEKCGRLFETIASGSSK